MELDFTKICRVCMCEGVMMPIFKVNISKKIMACASIQVWQNDGLPAQICNKCSAKLHIAFQFKRQCEKSDSKLRQYMSSVDEQTAQQQRQRQVHTQHQPTNPTQNCVYIECTPMLDIQQEEQKFDAFGNVTHAQAPPLTQINYNIQPPNNVNPLSYTLQTVEQVQVYNGTYTMPLQQMQPTNIIQDQIITQPIHIQNHAQQFIQHEPQQFINPEHVHNQSKETKDIVKKNVKMKKGVNANLTNKQCSTCGKTFDTTAKLSRHMKTHSSDMPYKCKICTKAFSHSGNYKIHLRMHTDERPFVCAVCNKGCRQAQDLEKHMRTHTGEKPHQCPMCPKAFSTSSNLTAHIRTHTGEKPYVCCVCQKAFCQSNELTKHMRTHTGEKSHICDICNKGCNGSSALIVHRRSHTGERPYICPICNKSFTQSSCLSVHRKKHNDEKKILCTICNTSFISSNNLKEHLLTHSQDKFCCHLCDVQFITASDLDEHVKNHNE